MTYPPQDPYGPAPDQGGFQPQQPPAYAQQPGVPGQPPYGGQAPASSTEKNWMGITSLILSLVGLFTWVTAIAGIVLGHLSLSAARRGEADNRGTGLAGLIIGYVVTVLGVIAMIVFFVLIGWVVSECGGSNPADWCTDTNA
ncbi:DUF4190 domain-containing protein [Demequina sp. SYSU T00192]|uniref:DUF4190 domain-containing protein n=1 Tax=Demequina litoralis TaxID=3051660 RepID=A0ABT8G9U9_9MICO|nr:DUF4190 domain-containing protein [Demequina sp. SYSU T00192]MDN4475857.1 DUF4190 domain-containing protein [Demequina sp. SYSU T00192]